MKVRFYPERKASKNNESTVWCYVREYKETLYLNTGQKINLEYWDADKQRAGLRKTRDNIVKGSLDDLNRFLNAFENKIFEIERNIRRKDFSAGFGVVADEIKKFFNKRKYGFFDLYEEFISIMEKSISGNQLSKHKRTRDLLLDYQRLNHDRLDFEKITPLFFYKLKVFLMSHTDFIDNTISKHITILKTFLIWANKNGHTNNSSYKAIKVKFEDNEIIYLTEDELMKLYNLEIIEDRLCRVRDVFIFQCFTGVRYSDVQNLSREDLKGADWYLRTQKTHEIIKIPLSSYALSILAKYSEYPQPLPVISNQKMNNYLKELCEKAEINDPVKIVKYKHGKRIETVHKKYELIGTHSARRTFVSLSLQKGMKPDVIMSITGHKTYRMMQKYLKIADPHKREEMDKVWGPPLRIVS